MNYQVDINTTLKRLKKNPYTDITIMNEEKMIGYISLCPIDQDTFKSILFHRASEEEIEANVLAYNKAGYYDAYLSSIVVDKENYPVFPGKFLFLHLQKHIQKLYKKGIFIRNIVAVAVSPSGRKTLQKMKFKEIESDVFLYSCLKQGMNFIKSKTNYAIWFILPIHISKKNIWGSV